MLANQSHPMGKDALYKQLHQERLQKGGTVSGVSSEEKVFGESMGVKDSLRIRILQQLWVAADKLS